MAAMDIFVRNTIPSIRSQTLASLSIPDDLKENDEVHWSWSHIQDKLRIKESMELFQKYQARLQHSLLVLMIILNLFQSTCALVVYFIMAKDLKDVSVSLTLRAISMTMYILFLCFSHKELWFRPNPSRIIVSLALLLSMAITTHGSVIYRISETEQCERGVRPTYYVILLIFIMLPFPRKWHCIVAGIAYTAMELTFVVICEQRNKNVAFHKFRPYMYASEAIFYVIGGLVGLFVRFLTELMNRRAFLDRRECIEAKRKMDIDKKQQESLLLSVIPQHIMNQVKDNIRQVITSFDKRVFNRRTFNELFIETYLDVSILYADIVNSVKLATHLSAFELVKTLDQLFARFDDMAESTRCFRVKLLGDCYYCVSGMPEKDRKHADNCVSMGLAMIDIIRHVRDEHKVDVDMRIGIHSGRVMCGLLGLCKWQYDIWSKDVLIASHMEQTGRPGHVHITDTTFKKLHEPYNPLFASDAHRRDSFLQQMQVEATYFIKRSTSATPISQPRRNSMYEVKEISPNGSPVPGVMSFRPQRASGSLIVGGDTRQRILGHYSLKQYRQLVSNINKDMDKEIEQMALSKKDQWCRPADIHPLLLKFADMSLEVEYQNQPDPLFKYYILCALIIFCGTTMIHILAIPWNAYLLGTFIIIGFILVLGTCFMWFGYICSFSKRVRHMRKLSRTVSQWQEFLVRASRSVSHSLKWRLSFWILTSGLLLAVAMLGLDDCESDKDPSLNSCNVSNFMNVKATDYVSNGTAHSTSHPLSCHDPWYFTFSAVLAMTSTSVFLRVHYWLKLSMHGIGATVFCYLIVHLESGVFCTGDRHFADWSALKNPLLSHCYFVVSFALTLHLLDRQVEYMCRVNFLAQRRVKGEQEEANILNQVNKALLINILPIHVARHYLDRDDDSNVDHVFYEEYKTVAVMFASMPEYSLFYTENMINEQGLRCLQLLNEIICDFDELFYMAMFRKVAKIKTVGSTYMAATGLLPDRDSLEGCSDEDETPAAVIMVQFATAMMEKLQQMNKDAQQDLRLRIGIAVGPVIAGVVGAVKPQYDIWGDTVNTASRMDSTGIVGRIQVTEEVANYLNGTNYEVECRGQREVKGKGMLTTYVVKTPFDGSHLETTRL